MRCRERESWFEMEGGGKFRYGMGGVDLPSSSPHPYALYTFPLF